MLLGPVVLGANSCGRIRLNLVDEEFSDQHFGDEFSAFLASRNAIFPIGEPI
jgi:hypothetical protein